jgi:hypothetical protein
MANAVFYLMEPTSISYTGTSATISANGSVSFSAVTALELRGVFSADYDNYMIVMRMTGVDASVNAQFLSGTTPASSNSYVRQYLNAIGSSVSGARGTAIDSFRMHEHGGISTSGTVVYFYGPNLTQPTAIRTVESGDFSPVGIQYAVATHNVSSSYDGLKIYAGYNNLSGRIAVYGMRK